MARSFTYADALELANKSLRRQMEDQLAATFCTLANAHIWIRWDWRESLKKMLPFYLIPDEQDYGPPQYAMPSNFLGLRNARIWDIDQNVPTLISEPLVKRSPPLTDLYGLPETVGFTSEVQKAVDDSAGPGGRIRVYPRPARNISAARYVVDCVYKFTPPLAAAATLAVTTLPFQDIHLQTYASVLQWVMEGRPPEKLQVMDYLISQMAEVEGLNLGIQSVHPDEPLVNWGDYSQSRPGSWWG